MDKDRLALTTAYLALLMALTSGLFLLLGPIYSYENIEVENGATTTTQGTASGLESGDPAILFWSGFMVAITAVGTYSATQRRAGPVLASGLILTAIAFLGMFSIGPFVLPSALALVSSGIIMRSAQA